MFAQSNFLDHFGEKAKSKLSNHVRNTMSFWSTSSAAPSLWMATGLQTLRPSVIRKDAPSYPKQPQRTHTRRSMQSDTKIIAEFWRSHYKGHEWKYDPSPGVVESLLESYIIDPSVYIFLLFTDTDLLIATIVSAFAGPTHMSHGAVLNECRIIEGLCVHTEYRGDGLAGYMIAYMDAVTSATIPSIHMWAREYPIAPPLTTAFSVKTYAYVIGSKAKKLVHYTTMNIEVFNLLWKKYSTGWTHSTEPAIVCSQPVLRRNDLHAFISNNIVAVITNTRRVAVGHEEGSALWEVVWCGRLHIDKLEPILHMSEAQDFLTSVAAGLGCILFASGTDHDVWLAPWQHGRSGVHAWYLYNYVPPAFGSCALHMIREEI